MRGPRLDAALVAVPALIATGAAAAAGHWLLAAVADGRWFSTSLLFIPLFFLAGMLAVNFAYGLVEERLDLRVASTRTAWRLVAGAGALAAIVIGGVIQPSVFVAIAATAAGGAFALKAQAEAIKREERNLRSA